MGIQSTQTTAGTFVVLVDVALAALSTRLTSLANDFKKWRFAAPLRMRFFLDYEPVLTVNTAVFANAGVVVGVGFYGAPSSAAAVPFNSVSDVAELVSSSVGFRSASCVVPLAVLREASVASWNYTGVGALTTAVEDAINGCIVCAISQQGTTANTSRYWLELSGVVELCEPTDPSVATVGDSWRSALSKKMAPSPMLAPEAATDDDEKGVSEPSSPQGGVSIGSMVRWDADSDDLTDGVVVKAVVSQVSGKPLKLAPSALVCPSAVPAPRVKDKR